MSLNLHTKGGMAKVHMSLIDFSRYSEFISSGEEELLVTIDCYEKNISGLKISDGSAVAIIVVESEGVLMEQKVSIAT